MESAGWLASAVGVLAGICSMASFLPQIAKIWRERQAVGVSLRMFAVTMTAFALWTAFGLLQRSWPIALANAVCFVLAGSIVALRLRFGDGEADGQPR